MKQYGLQVFYMISNSCLDHKIFLYFFTFQVFASPIHKWCYHYVFYFTNTVCQSKMKQI